MATDVQFEIERVRRLLEVFGWTVVATGIDATTITVTVELKKEK